MTARGAFFGAGLLSLAGYAWLAFVFEGTNRGRDVGLFLALLGTLFLLLPAALRAARRMQESERSLGLSTTGWVLLFAGLFRLVMLGAGLPKDRPLDAVRADLHGQGPGYDAFLLYDNDAWRYLWDGHVTATGLDPYSLTPAEIESLHFEGAQSPYASLLDEPLWLDVWDRISYRSYTSVYPPGAQLLFAGARWLAPGSMLVLKLLVAAADLGTCWLLVLLLRGLGRRPEAALLYAWNPLAIKEFAGTGHVDAVMVFLFMAALLAVVRGRQRGGAAWFSASVLIKLAPLPAIGVLLPRQRQPGWWKRWWPGAVVAIGVCLPFLAGLPRMLQGIGAYSREWIFNAGFWNLVAGAASPLGADSATGFAHAVSRGVILIIALRVSIALWRASRPAPEAPEPTPAWAQQRVDAAFLILASLVWLGPAVMPWYLLWAAPLAVAAGLASWTLLTALSLLSYLIYYFRTEQAAWLWAEHSLFLLAFLWELRQKPELRQRLASLLSPHRTPTST